MVGGWPPAARHDRRAGAGRAGAVADPAAGAGRDPPCRVLRRAGALAVDRPGRLRAAQRRARLAGGAQRFASAARGHPGGGHGVRPFAEGTDSRGGAAGRAAAAGVVVQRHARAARRVLRAPGQLFRRHRPRAAHAADPADDPHRGGADPRAQPGGISGRALRQPGRSQAHGADDRRHAVPGQGRQRPDRPRTPAAGAARVGGQTAGLLPPAGGGTRHHSAGQRPRGDRR
ncbi:hypothetical protein D3C86_1453770 [compost metagenome]